MQTKKLLTISAVAEILNITTSRGYELARLGLLPAVRIGRQVRVDPDRLQAWIEAGGQGLSLDGQDEKS